ARGMLALGARGHVRLTLAPLFSWRRLWFWLLPAFPQEGGVRGLKGVWAGALPRQRLRASGGRSADVGRAIVPRHANARPRATACSPTANRSPIRRRTCKCI